MFLKDNEKEMGYTLQWKNRDSKILLKRNKVIGTVKSRPEVYMAIDSHERYLDILKANSESVREVSPIDKAHIIAFIVMVFVIAVVSVVASS